MSEVPEVQNPRKLLTPVLKQKIEKRARELLDLSAALWPDHTAKFNDAPIIRYDIKNRFGGTAQTGGHEHWTIRLNLILCYENEAHFIEQTVGHEVAHLVCDTVYGHTKLVEDPKTGKKVVKKIRPHGPEWRSVMVKLGLPPLRTHSYDTSSIQLKPRKISARGGLVAGGKAAEMLKRLETGFKRLDDQMKLECMKMNFKKLEAGTRESFISWAEANLWTE